MSIDDSLPTDLASAHALIIAQRAALSAAEQRAAAAESEAQYRALLIEKLKFTIRKLRHDRFGQSSERGALLDQLELQLADLEADAAQAEAAAQMAAAAASRDDDGAVVRTAQAGAPSAARASAARADRLSGAVGLPVLRRHDIAQDRRGRDRDAGARSAPVEGDPARAREVLLPGLRSDQPAAGPIAPDRARARRARSCSPISCSPSTACICRSTAKARSMPGKASISTSRRSPTGWARRRRR